LFDDFLDQTAVGWNKSSKFPVQREKTGILLAPAARAVAQPAVFPRDGGGHHTEKYFA
jgi:hypothetical protein